MSSDSQPMTLVDVPGRYSRVCGEQYPDARYSSAIEKPRPKEWSPAFEAVCFVAALALLGWMFWMGLGMPRPW